MSGYSFKNDRAFTFGNVLASTVAFTLVLWALCLVFGYPAWAHNHVALLVGTALAYAAGRWQGLRTGAENG